MNDRHFADLSLELNRHIVNLLDSLSALSALAQLSIDALDEPALLKRALAALMSNQDMERCSIFLIEGDELVCAAGLDWDEMLQGELAAADAAPRSAARYPRQAGLMGEAASSGQLVHCPSCAEDERFRRLGGLRVEGALLCVPITCEAQTLGVLNEPLAKLPAGQLLRSIIRLGATNFRCQRWSADGGVSLMAFSSRCSTKLTLHQKMHG